MDDLQALRALARNDVRADRESAAAYFYFERGKELMAHFARNGAPGDHAEDVLQETIEKLVLKADTFRGETVDSARAWVWTVAKHTLADYRDRRNALTRGEVPLDDTNIDGDGTEGGYHPPDSVRGDPARDWYRAQAQQCVRTQLREFARSRSRDVEALWLVTQGHSIDEVANRLGKTRNATAVYLTGCRDRIRPWLETCRRYLDGLAP